MNIKTFLLTFLAIAVFSGCYTRLGSIEQPGQQLNSADTLQDSIEGSAQVDTIIYKEKEICIWERDFTGMPRLRCFPSYYPRDWYFYSSSPWWFRNSASWYDYKRCPRYYYFDPHCGCCKYYRSYPYMHHGGGTGGGGNHGSDVSGRIPNRTRSIGSAGSPPVHQSGTTLPKSTQNNTENRGANPADNSAPKRSRDVGQMGSSGVRQQSQVEGAVQKRVEAGQEYRTPAVVEQPDKPPRSDSSVVVPRTSPKRNSRW